MRKRKIEQMALTTLSVAACVALFGACAAVKHAHAQGGIAAARALGSNRVLSGPPPLDSVPSMPAPIFNPFTPYTLPPPGETPVSPGSPGSVFGPAPSTGIN